MVVNLKFKRKNRLTAYNALIHGIHSIVIVLMPNGLPFFIYLFTRLRHRITLRYREQYFKLYTIFNSIRISY